MALLILERHRREFRAIHGLSPIELDPARLWCWADLPGDDAPEPTDRPLRTIRLLLRNPLTLKAGPGKVLARDHRCIRASMTDRYSIARYPNSYKWWVQLPINKKAV